MPAKNVLVIDVGGTHVKVGSSDHKDIVKLESGPAVTPAVMVAAVKKATAGWEYDAVAIGYPGPVLHGRPVAEPHNLGVGWVGFDFRKAFGKPVKLVNDAAMQALGSYEGEGKMLFLGLGTGMGSALVVDGVVEPMELAHLPFRKATFEDYVGESGLERLGKKRWRAAVLETIETLTSALEPDYVVLGGGNAKKVGELPANVRVGSNGDAFTGGFRLWNPSPATSPPAEG